MGERGTAAPARRAAHTRRSPAQGRHAGSPHPTSRSQPTWRPRAMRPHAWLPTSPVSDDCVQGRADGTWAGVVTTWRARHRVDAGREPPSAACSARHAVHTTARGGPAPGSEGGKHIPGRQRPLGFETLGWLMTIVLTRAGLDEGGAALHMLGPVTPPALPLSSRGCRAAGSHPDRAAGMAEHRGGWRIAVKTRAAGTPGVAAGETLGDREHERLAWSVPAQPHGL